MTNHRARGSFAPRYRPNAAPRCDPPRDGLPRPCIGSSSGPFKEERWRRCHFRTPCRSTIRASRPAAVLRGPARRLAKAPRLGARLNGPRPRHAQQVRPSAKPDDVPPPTRELLPSGTRTLDADRPYSTTRAAHADGFATSPVTCARRRHHRQRVLRARGSRRRVPAAAVRDGEATRGRFSVSGLVWTAIASAALRRRWSRGAARVASVAAV